jgi:hypothetical protein
VTNESCQLRVTLKHPSNCQLGVQYRASKLTA